MRIMSASLPLSVIGMLWLSVYSILAVFGTPTVTGQAIPDLLSMPPASTEPAAPAASISPSLPSAMPSTLGPAPSQPSLNGPPASSTSPSSRASATPAATTPAATSSQPVYRDYVENGIRYRETKQMVRQPVQRVRYVDQPQMGYQQRLRTDMQTVNYYTQVPVTNYECVPRLYDWWRVFQGGYVAYGMEPYTTFQTQPQSTTVPVTRPEVIPVTRTVRVAKTELQFVQREQVTRVALGPVGSNAAIAADAPRLPAQPSYIPPPPVYIPPVGVAPRGRSPGPIFGGPVGGGGAPTSFNPFGGFGVASDAGSRRGGLGGGLGVGAPIPGVGSGASGGYLPVQPGAPAPGFIPSNSPGYLPPTPSLSPTVSSEPTNARYGGVARFDSESPRYGTRR